MKSKSKFGRKVPKDPFKRAGHVVCANIENAYLVGGYNTDGPLADIWEYNFCGWKESRTKSMSTPFQFPRMEFGSCSTAGGIYLFGGIQHDEREVSILNDLWIFESSTCKWKILFEESVCSERSGHAMVAADDHTILIHGGDCMKPLDDMWVFDVPTSQFSKVSPLNGISPPPRSAHSAAFCAASKTFCIFGGVTIVKTDDPEDSQHQYLNDLWIIRMQGDLTSLIWQRIELENLAPSPRDASAITFLSDNKILLFGGYGLREVGNDDEVYDDESNEDNEENSADEYKQLVISEKVHSECSFKTRESSESVDPILDAETYQTGTSKVGSPQEIDQIRKCSKHLSKLSVQLGISEDVAADAAEVGADSALGMKQERLVSIHDESSGVADIFGRNEDESPERDDDVNGVDVEGVVETYLDDAWVIDLSTKECTLVNLDDFVLSASQSPDFFAARRGSAFIFVRSGPSLTTSLLNLAQGPEQMLNGAIGVKTTTEAIATAVDPGTERAASEQGAVERAVAVSVEIGLAERGAALEVKASAEGEGKGKGTETDGLEAKEASSLISRKEPQHKFEATQPQYQCFLFGGFDGEIFYGSSPLLDLESLLAAVSDH